MITSLLKSLTKTLIIELIISIILGIKNKDDIKVVICANIITNPVIVYITNCIMLFNNMILYFYIVIILEIIVFTHNLCYADLIYPDHPYKPSSPGLHEPAIVNVVPMIIIGVVIAVIVVATIIILAKSKKEKDKEKDKRK